MKKSTLTALALVLLTGASAFADVKTAICYNSKASPDFKVCISGLGESEGVGYSAVTYDGMVSIGTQFDWSLSTRNMVIKEFNSDGSSSKCQVAAEIRFQTMTLSRLKGSDDNCGIAAGIYIQE